MSIIPLHCILMFMLCLTYQTYHSWACTQICKAKDDILEKWTIHFTSKCCEWLRWCAQIVNWTCWTCFKPASRTDVVNLRVVAHFYNKCAKMLSYQKYENKTQLFFFKNKKEFSFKAASVLSPPWKNPTTLVIYFYRITANGDRSFTLD